MPEFPLFLGGMTSSAEERGAEFGGGENSEGFSLSENHTSCK
ncbi:hypothetical protein LEP1GSC038_1884 [Leptospira weilii str. 2006001855]|uniref:Uncharacterized protein n=1 Tax=Leptospira weilii str. 2006001855 TaxID=996804 RepID=M6FRA0_9LEPT|nr:hypothetical protein LEP1GSC038_1884 [Leptospira weilii str. 2006001855]EMN43756.1 hypothetical protein LEP1GSC086_4579 [Leptospira weilii str. LNT 1234]